MRLFARDGFAAVSMRQIAAEVDMQAGALYNYTPDKQSLLFDLMHRHMEELLAALAQAGIETGTPCARLDRFVRFHVSWHLPRRDGVFLSYMELRNLIPENFERIEAQRRVYEDALEDILRDGMTDGAFDISEPRLTAMALIALLTGVTNWYKSGGRLTQQAIEELYVGLVRGAVGLNPDAPGEIAAQ